MPVVREHPEITLTGPNEKKRPVLRVVRSRIETLQNEKSEFVTAFRDRHRKEIENHISNNQYGKAVSYAGNLAERYDGTALEDPVGQLRQEVNKTVSEEFLSSRETVNSHLEKKNFASALEYIDRISDRFQNTEYDKKIKHIRSNIKNYSRKEGEASEEWDQMKVNVLLSRAQSSLRDRKYREALSNLEEGLRMVPEHLEEAEEIRTDLKFYREMAGGLQKLKEKLITAINNKLIPKTYHLTNNRTIVIQNITDERITVKTGGETSRLKWSDISSHVLVTLFQSCALSAGNRLSLAWFCDMSTMDRTKKTILYNLLLDHPGYRDRVYTVLSRWENEPVPEEGYIYLGDTQTWLPWNDLSGPQKNQFLDRTSRDLMKQFEEGKGEEGKRLLRKLFIANAEKTQTLIYRMTVKWMETVHETEKTLYAAKKRKLVELSLDTKHRTAIEKRKSRTLQNQKEILRDGLRILGYQKKKSILESFLQYASKNNANIYDFLVLNESGILTSYAQQANLKQDRAIVRFLKKTRSHNREWIKWKQSVLNSLEGINEKLDYSTLELKKIIKDYVSRWESKRRLKEMRNIAKKIYTMFLGTGRREEVEKILKKGLHANNPFVRVETAKLLAILPRTGFKGEIRDLITKTVEPRILRPLIKIVGDLQIKEVDDFLINKLQHKEEAIQFLAIESLGKIRTASGVSPLISKMETARPKKREIIGKALHQITTMDYGNRYQLWRKWWRNHRASFRPPKESEVKDQSGDEHRTTTTTFYGSKIDSRRIIFCTDISGSMRERGDIQEQTDPPEGIRPPKEPSKLGVAKYELKKAIYGLNKQHYFNIIFFNEGLYIWKKKAVAQATKDNKRYSYRFIGKFHARGGTNIYDSLKTAFMINYRPGLPERFRDSIDTIYLLSDGLPSSGSVDDKEEILRRVGLMYLYRKIQINTVIPPNRNRTEEGFYKAAKKFMKKIAEKTEGTFIEP